MLGTGELPWEAVAAWATEPMAELAADVPRLRAELEAARDAPTLPDHADPAAVEALHELVVRTRPG